MTGNTFSSARLALLVFLLGLHVPHHAGGAALEASDSTVSGPTLDLRLGRDRAYPGEDIEVTVTLVVGQEPLRNVQYPTLAGTGYRLSEFGPPRQKALEHEGRTLDAQEFVARLTPSRSGDYQVGPATLKAEVLLPGSGAAAFFGNNEPTPLKLESPSANLHVLPLPREGRPAGFTGAIGRFTLDRQVNPGEVQRGDPLTVTTVIRGEGNIEAFACPKLELHGVRSYPPRSRRTAESLSCEQVLVAEAASGLTVPATAISFFDPRTGRYRMVSADAVQVPVRPPPGCSARHAGQRIARAGRETESGCYRPNGLLHLGCAALHGLADVSGRLWLDAEAPGHGRGPDRARKCPSTAP